MSKYVVMLFLLCMSVTYAADDAWKNVQTGERWGGLQLWGIYNGGPEIITFNRDLIDQDSFKKVDAVLSSEPFTLDIPGFIVRLYQEVEEESGRPAVRIDKRVKTSKKVIVDRLLRAVPDLQQPFALEVIGGEVNVVLPSRLYIKFLQQGDVPVAPAKALKETDVGYTAMEWASFYFWGIRNGTDEVISIGSLEVEQGSVEKVGKHLHDEVFILSTPDSFVRIYQKIEEDPSKTTLHFEKRLKSGKQVEDDCLPVVLGVMQLFGLDVTEKGVSLVFPGDLYNSSDGKQKGFFATLFGWKQD